jgi:DNA-directed RNA polymerase subunit H (RpoH/RPB5)
MINITQHAFLPTFTKMSQKEKEDLIQYYNTSEKDFPAFLQKDPVVKYYDWKIGDMIRIERYNGTDSPDLYYRIVC